MSIHRFKKKKQKNPKPQPNRKRSYIKIWKGEPPEKPSGCPIITCI